MHIQSRVAHREKLEFQGATISGVITTVVAYVK